MRELETLIALLLVAVTLAALARRAGAPYPAFLALGGAVLAFVPGTPVFSVDPELALALFVAPVLLDAAYDTSVRDLRENWGPVASLVLVSVGLTTIAVAAVVRALVPEIPWAPAIALGAIVSPPDAAAATTVLRQLKLPHRLVTILQGESLLNDATALLIFRLALTAMAAQPFSLRAAAPTLLFALAGSVIVGPVLAWIVVWFTKRVQDAPTAIVLQFVSTFGVWILAERAGLSPVLAMVCYAMSVARRAPGLTPARIRVPSYAVWDTAVFVLNVLAFAFIGLQIRPVLANVSPAVRTGYLAVGSAVLLTVIVVRMMWVMSHTAVNMWRARRFGFHPRRPRLPPTFRGSLVISWCGMRGIVSLAAALSLPAHLGGSPFPFRDLIVLTAFLVVLGTLVVQGLTLKPLLETLALHDDDLVGREVTLARGRAVRAALATFEGDRSAAAQVVRQEFLTHMKWAGEDGVSGVPDTAHERIHRRALAAARRVILDMRATNDIGDDAFHRLEEELDWLEMGSGARDGASADGEFGKPGDREAADG